MVFDKKGLSRGTEKTAEAVEKNVAKKNCKKGVIFFRETGGPRNDRRGENPQFDGEKKKKKMHEGELGGTRNSYAPGKAIVAHSRGGIRKKRKRVSWQGKTQKKKPCPEGRKKVTFSGKRKKEVKWPQKKWSPKNWIFLSEETGPKGKEPDPRGGRY